jgi:hypothetical protein
MVNIATIIGLPYINSLAVVKLTYLERLTGTFFLIIVLLIIRELVEG